MSNIKIGYGGRAKETAILLIAAARELGYDDAVVRTGNGGFNVPEDVAAKAGFEAPPASGDFEDPRDHTPVDVPGDGSDHVVQVAEPKEPVAKPDEHPEMEARLVDEAKEVIEADKVADAKSDEVNAQQGESKTSPSPETTTDATPVEEAKPAAKKAPAKKAAAKKTAAKKTAAKKAASSKGTQE